VPTERASSSWRESVLGIVILLSIATCVGGIVAMFFSAARQYGPVASPAPPVP
jgi:hypothetical protein